MRLFRLALCFGAASPISAAAFHVLQPAFEDLVAAGCDARTGPGHWDGNKNIISLETGWKNNIRMDSGFFPGSGFQTPGDGSTGAIRGRLEFVNRQGNLRFVAQFENGSAEHTKLKAQTTGTAVIHLQDDADNALDLTWQKVAFSVVEIAEMDQTLSVAVECLPMYHVSNGILTAVGKCSSDGICQ